jgi:hypothetical protein
MVTSAHEFARYTKMGGFTNAGCQVTWITECCVAASNICVSTVWNFRHVVLQASRILKWLLFLENLCTPAVRYTVVATIKCLQNYIWQPFGPEDIRYHNFYCNYLNKPHLSVSPTELTS